MFCLLDTNTHVNIHNHWAVCSKTYKYYNLYVLSESQQKRQLLRKKNMMRLLTSVTHKVILSQVLELTLQPFDNLYLASSQTGWIFMSHWWQSDCDRLSSGNDE